MGKALVGRARSSLSMSGGPPDSGYKGVLHWVPAGTTVAQILDYYSNTSADWPFSIYQLTAPNRTTAMTYASLSRAVFLIASLIAQVVTGGGLHVVDQKGRVVNNNKAKRAIDALLHTPDGETPAYQWVEDTVIDLLLDGNYVVHADQMMNSWRLYRCVVWDATTLRAPTSKALTYEVHTIMHPEKMQMVNYRNILHGRWGRAARYGYSRSGRESFATAPVIALRPTLEIGLWGDQWIREFYKSGLTGGNKSKIGVGFEGALTADQTEQIAKFVDSWTRSGNKPLVLGGRPNFFQFKESPQDADSHKLREQQMIETLMYYGMPKEVAGLGTTDWNHAEKVLTIMWRLGVRQHLDRFFAPFNARMLDPGHRLNIDDLDLLRGDTEAQAKMITALGGDAQRRTVGTLDERRRVAGLPIGIEPEDERSGARTGRDVDNEQDKNGT